MTNPNAENQVDIGSLYPDETIVEFRGVDAPLGWFKQMEESQCRPKDPAARFDLEKRNQYYARVLHATGALLPEHYQYLPEDVQQ